MHTVPTPSTAAWKQVAAGSATTCALDKAGTVECWGDGLHGELGNATGGTPLPAVRWVDLPPPAM
jgi:alpha-tubulin suppressor-like RCC1 family protein